MGYAPEERSRSLCFKQSPTFYIYDVLGDNGDAVMKNQTPDIIDIDAYFQRIGYKERSLPYTQDVTGNSPAPCRSHSIL